MSLWSPAEIRLVDLLARVERGPRQQALFALWLAVRVATGVLPPTSLDPKSHRRRVAHLKRRIGSLSLPGPLRRVFANTYAQLETGDPDEIAAVMHEWSAAARTMLGEATARAIDRAADEFDEYRVAS